MEGDLPDVLKRAIAVAPVTHASIPAAGYVVRLESLWRRTAIDRRNESVWYFDCMKRYVAFLRAVNVGGTGKLPMADLRQMFAELGFSDVKTYIASGNVAFSSEEIGTSDQVGPGRDAC